MMVGQYNRSSLEKGGTPAVETTIDGLNIRDTGTRLIVERVCPFCGNPVRLAEGIAPSSITLLDILEGLSRHWIDFHSQVLNRR